MITDGNLEIADDLVNQMSSLSFPFTCSFHMLCLTSPPEFSCSLQIKRLTVSTINPNHQVPLFPLTDFLVARHLDSDGISWRRVVLS